MSYYGQTNYTNYYSSSPQPYASPYSSGYGHTSYGSGSYYYGSYSGSSSSPPSSGNLAHVYGVCPIGPLAPGGIASTR